MTTDELLELALRLHRNGDPQTADELTKEDDLNAELRRRVSVEKLSDAQWRWIIDQFDVVTVRPSWPRGVPLYANFGIPRWLGPTEITFCADVENAVSVQIGTFEAYWDWDCMLVLARTLGMRFVGIPSRSMNSIDFQCDVQRPGADNKPNSVWRGVVRRPIEIVDSNDEAITPILDARLDQIVREELESRLEIRYGGLCVENEVVHPDLETIALGLVVEVYRGETRFDGALCLAGRYWSCDQRLIAIRQYARYDEFPLPGEPACDGWRVVVRGVAEMSLLEFDKERYWAGEFTLPLRQVLKPEEGGWD